MKALLIGASGMLGHDLATSVPENVQLHTRTRRELDITDDVTVSDTLDLVAPDVVINATGYTAVDRAESERAHAFEVNARAVGSLAFQCSGRGIVVVHFSTDYIFDGCSSRPYHEEDPPRPLSVYGASKLAGEQALRSAGGRALIIRTQWLFGTHGASFPRTMAERAKRREPTRVVADQWGRPTSVADVARTAWELLCLGELGVFHVCNSGEATWYNVARAVFTHYGVPELVTPCTTAEYPRPATRPRYSVLDTRRAERALGRSLPDWRIALGGFLDLIG